MDDTQHYKWHFVHEIETATIFLKADVLTLATKLAEKDYVQLTQNNEDATKRPDTFT